MVPAAGVVVSVAGVTRTLNGPAVAGGENSLEAVTEYVKDGIPPAGTPLIVPVVGLIDRNEGAVAVSEKVGFGNPPGVKVAW